MTRADAKLILYNTVVVTFAAFIFTITGSWWSIAILLLLATIREDD